MNKLKQKQIDGNSKLDENSPTWDAKIGTNDADSEAPNDADYYKDFSTNTGPDIVYML